MLSPAETARRAGLRRRTWLAAAALLPAWPALHAQAPARIVLPPDATLHYALRRGLLSGSGELLWRRQGEAYELKLSGEVAGFSVLTQHSIGHVDAAGLAPDRFTDQRLRRAPRVARFERDRQRVSFSSSTETYPIVAGMQDRLSWLIQLPARVAADPALCTAGARVAMFVVGSRGDGGLWAFEFVQWQALETPGGAVRAAKFTRRPRKPDDSEVEVWLDPARHALPVLARLGERGGDDVLELRLRDVRLP